MITIKNGDNTIYDPRNPYLKLIDPKLVLEDNAAGQLTFKIYDSNLNYNTIKKLYPVLAVVSGGKTCFFQRLLFRTVFIFRHSL